MKRKKKKNLLSRLNTIGIFIILISPFLIVFSQASLSKANIELERTKIELVKQEKKNESLEMKIDELASLNKMKEVAKNEGLRYNSSNIIKVSTNNRG